MHPPYYCSSDSALGLQAFGKTQFASKLSLLSYLVEATELGVTEHLEAATHSVGWPSCQAVCGHKCIQKHVDILRVTPSFEVHTTQVRQGQGRRLGVHMCGCVRM